MGTVTVSLPADGSTGTVSQYNTPLTTIVNEFNGNIDNANIKSSAAIDPSKISGGNSSMFTSWQSWTPTWTNLTVGNGTVTAKYVQVGKSIQFKLSLVFGSSTAVSGSVSVTLPVTSTALVGSGVPLGSARLIDISAGLFYVGFATHLSTTTMKVSWSGASGSGQIETNLSNVSPVTWAVSDEFQINGFYEAA